MAIPKSTMEAATKAAEDWWEFPQEVVAEKVIEAALEDGGVVLGSQFSNVCDYLLAWTGFNEYALVNVTTMEMLVPKFKYDELVAELDALKNEKTP